MIIVDIGLQGEAEKQSEMPLKFGVGVTGKKEP